MTKDEIIFVQTARKNGISGPQLAEMFGVTPSYIYSLYKTKQLSYKEKIKQRSIVDPDTNCWIWTGPSDGRYGQMSYKGKCTRVHKVAYEEWKGTIPYQSHLVIRHLCNNSLCCNPSHLKLGSLKDNYIDSYENGTSYVGVDKLIRDLWKI